LEQQRGELAGGESQQEYAVESQQQSRLPPGEYKALPVKRRLRMAFVCNRLCPGRSSCAESISAKQQKPAAVGRFSELEDRRGLSV